MKLLALTIDQRALILATLDDPPDALVELPRRAGLIDSIPATSGGLGEVSRPFANEPQERLPSRKSDLASREELGRHDQKEDQSQEKKPENADDCAEDARPHDGSAISSQEHVACACRSSGDDRKQSEGSYRAEFPPAEVGAVPKSRPANDRATDQRPDQPANSDAHVVRHRLTHLAPLAIRTMKASGTPRASGVKSGYSAISRVWKERLVLALKSPIPTKEMPAPRGEVGDARSRRSYRDYRA